MSLACSRKRKTDLHMKWGKPGCRSVERWSEGGRVVRGSVHHRKEFRFIVSAMESS